MPRGEIGSWARPSPAPLVLSMNLLRGGGRARVAEGTGSHSPGVRGVGRRAASCVLAWPGLIPSALGESRPWCGWPWCGWEWSGWGPGRGHTHQVSCVSTASHLTSRRLGPHGDQLWLSGAVIPLGSTECGPRPGRGNLSSDGACFSEAVGRGSAEPWFQSGQDSCGPFCCTRLTGFPGSIAGAPSKVGPCWLQNLGARGGLQLWGSPPLVSA